MSEPIECECGHAWRQHDDIGQCCVDFRRGDRVLPCICEQYRPAKVLDLVRALEESLAKARPHD